MHDKFEEAIAKQNEDQSKLQRYVDIVLQENKSLTQQVGVLNEMLSQKERDFNKMKGEVVDLELKVSASSAEKLALAEQRQALEREKRMHHHIQLTLDKEKERSEALESEYRLLNETSHREITEFRAQLSEVQTRN